jgi:hypothetical protein
MSVDMSPEAVSRRLHIMDELWELSVALMDSEPANTSTRRRRSSALEIYDSIRHILLRDWDPIGVDDITDASDEYDSYIAPVYRILIGDRSEDDLVECLARIEREEMGVVTSYEVRQLAAKNLLQLNVNLDTHHL